jgi:hypothetical protein
VKVTSFNKKSFSAFLLIEDILKNSIYFILLKKDAREEKETVEPKMMCHFLIRKVLYKIWNQ